jgi:bifunctional UDP-N-acetylglucosamine pyrophosphorylase/glucosamine-1-phosphate N-acetyltransferase
VNTQKELARATKYIFKKRAEHWMDQGCIILDPDTAYIEESVHLESGVVLYPNVHLRGATRVGTCSVIENNCVVQDSAIQAHAAIKANSHLESCSVGAGALIGPFARLRPKAEIGAQAHIGNFVEIKNAKIGQRSKANHHTYLGDAEIGEDTNIGCGTITCNYAADKRKYKTIIGDRVFVGSDSQFVAPVKVGNDAVIGSGSTITKDVPERALAIARSKQWMKEGYVKPAPELESESESESEKTGE